MSSTTAIYIEYRRSRRKDGVVPPWKLLSVYSDFEEENAFDIEKEAIVEIGGRKFIRRYNDYFQGCVRNFLNDECEEISRRGFPTDLSEGLKAIFDEQQKEIEKDSAARGFGEWRWNKSWCTLSELGAQVDSQYHKCIANILDSHTKKISKGIQARLDEIIARLDKKEKPKKQIPETEDEEYEDEDLQYLLDEELDTIVYLKSFCEHIRMTVSALTDCYPCNEDIRIVYYTC